MSELVDVERLAVRGRLDPENGGSRYKPLPHWQEPPEPPPHLRLCPNVKLTRCATQFLHDDAMCLVSHSKSSILLIGSRAQEASVAELLPHVHGKGIIDISLASDRFRDFMT